MMSVSQVTEEMLQFDLVTRARHQVCSVPISARHLRVRISVQMSYLLFCMAIESTVSQLQARTVGVLVGIKKYVGPIILVIVPGTSVWLQC